MGALMIEKTHPETEDETEVDVRELALRLKTLMSGCDMEIIQLAISSMLDEISDVIKD